MSQRAFVKFAALTGIMVVLLALGLAIILIQHNRQGPQGTDTPDQHGFDEDAVGAGITFKMMFLPGEQGERFKGNLYDHGCGLAIADFDGDGLDDIYFTNQLGRNALYRNNGDGTF